MKRTWLIATSAVALFLSVPATAQEYKVVVPQLSPATTELYKKLVTSILEAGGAKASIEVVPFMRAMYKLENRSADLLLLAIENPDPARAAAQKTDYSTATLFRLAFVLYANKSKPVDPAELKSGNPRRLTVETDSAHLDYFPFGAKGSMTIDSSLEKLALERIDAFVFAQPSTDAALKRLQIKNVSRQFYGFYDTKVLLQKGARGGTLDRLITAGLQKMKADGSYDRLMAQYLETASRYVEWQP